MPITDSDRRGEHLTRHLRGCGDMAMTTDEIMALTRRMTVRHGAHP